MWWTGAAACGIDPTRAMPREQEMRFEDITKRAKDRAHGWIVSFSDSGKAAVHIC